MADLTRYHIFISLVVAVAGFTFGFGSAIFVLSIGQPGFYAYFNLDPTSLHTANTLGAINALFYTGAAIGAIVQSFLADWIGRKRALIVTTTIVLVGNALVAGSVTMAMLITVRTIQGLGLGMILAAVPLYLTEVAPPRRRGFMAGITTLSYSFGYSICGWSSVGAYHATNLTLSWRLPLALACVPPLILLFGLFFIPETPRYLIWRERHEEALAIIKKLHDDAGAQAEYTQIVAQLTAENADAATFLHMFTKPSWRRRSFLTMFLMFGSQCTGILGITNYLPLIFASLGFEKDLPLILYGMYMVATVWTRTDSFSATLTTIGMVFVYISMLVVDRVGRRTLFLIGFISLAFLLLAEALLQWKYVGTDNRPGNIACVAMIFFYNIVFQCVDAPAFIWTAEIFPMNIRAKGVSLALFSLFVGIITFTAPSPVAFRKIGWHIFLVYLGLTIIVAIIVYFYIPETKGLPVEEIGAKFGDEAIVHMTSDGLDIVEKHLVEEKVAIEEVEGTAMEVLSKV